MKRVIKYIRTYWRYVMRYRCWPENYGEACVRLSMDYLYHWSIRMVHDDAS